MTQVNPVPRPLRRVPMQERSLARVNRMLDACAQLIDELGYDGLSTTLLAERAGVAIGSVYQFFPDKRAVVHALTHRNVERYCERFRTRVLREPPTKWWDVVDSALDEYADMHRRVPGFRTLRFGDVVDPFPARSGFDESCAIVDMLRGVLVNGVGLADGTQLRGALAVAAEIGDALTRLAFRASPVGDPDILVEAKKIVRDYLDRHLG